ncbi:hypothetical protein BGZ52_003977 [Haplosporangium bisporale]|nr:hypothetical protein BGZ52_003977 [Haplosporangium bisporale]
MLGKDKRQKPVGLNLAPKICQGFCGPETPWPPLDQYGAEPTWNQSLLDVPTVSEVEKYNAGFGGWAQAVSNVVTPKSRPHPTISSVGTPRNGQVHDKPTIEEPAIKKRSANAEITIKQPVASTYVAKDSSRALSLMIGTSADTSTDTFITVELTTNEPSLHETALTDLPAEVIGSHKFTTKQAVILMVKLADIQYLTASLFHAPSVEVPRIEKEILESLEQIRSTIASLNN